MDMSFANQALSLVHLMSQGRRLENQAHRLPVKIDQRIATLKRQAMGLGIDRLSEEQQTYLSSWEEGT
jgi:adenosylhomocysteinase